jgi:hypothetical protein
MAQDKLSRDLKKVLARAATDAGDLPIVVLCSVPPDLPRLEEAGMSVSHVFESIQAASGRASRQAIEALAGLDDVVRIDLDSEARAM